MKTAKKRRAHARVVSDVACVVDGSVDGQIRNLSLGGALLVGAPGFAEMDDTVSLEFDVGDGSPLAVLGEVVRITVNGPDAEYGIQLVTVENAERARLARFIDTLMLGRGAERREAPRLYRRMELRCRGAEEFSATMNNVSLGGLGLESDVPLKLGEEVSVEMFGDPLDSRLEISGVVKHVRLGELGLHLAGLRIVRLAHDQRARFGALIESVLHGR